MALTGIASDTQRRILMEPDETEFDDHRLPDWAVEEWWREMGMLREDNFS